MSNKKNKKNETKESATLDTLLNETIKGILNFDLMAGKHEDSILKAIERNVQERLAKTKVAKVLSPETQSYLVENLAENLRDAMIDFLRGEMLTKGSDYPYDVNFIVKDSINRALNSSMSK